MSRTMLCLAAVAAFVQPCQAGPTVTSSELLIRLNVRAAAAPKPALRYRLLPELREMNPGNPIQNYMKCMMEQKKFFFGDEAFQYREKLLAMPLNELPTQDLEEYGRYALDEADRAARLDNPDWQILLKLKADGTELLLPEVQQLRSLARALQARFRTEIAQCRFDDAIRTAKTMFAISRHLGEHPTLIGDLVGIAIASLAVSHLDEMLDQPGCPNLFWALTTLPVPMISLEKGMDGERVMLACVFRNLEDSKPMSKNQLKKFIADIDRLLEIGLGKPDKSGVQKWLDAHSSDAAMVSAGRHRLIENGLAEPKLLTFPAEQVLLLDEKRELEARCDDDMKTFNLPYWQTERLNAQNQSKKPPALLADLLMPITVNVRRAQARLDQRIALLRHVEALRLFAAEHNGSLPTTLSECSLPLPDDPFTGKPFRYERNGITAHLRGSPPAAEQNNAKFNVHYELTLQK